MILQYALSADVANALRVGDVERLAPLRTRLDAWIVQSQTQPVTALQITGVPIRTAHLGPTPCSTQAPLSREAACMMRMIECLASCLGDCVTFAGMKQSDRTVQQVFPVAGFEDKQSAASSRTTLSWHTEHADKDMPPDFLVITCLRNTDHVGTRLSRPDCSQFDDVDVKILSTAAEFSFTTRDANVAPIAVLDHWGLRFDPVYCQPQSADAARALQRLINAVEENAVIVPQEPGTVLLIPNRSTVHARDSFQARYDGTDRWLMRSMVRLRQ